MHPRRLSARALWGLASWALPLALVFVATPFLLDALGAQKFGVLMVILLSPLLASQLDLGITSSSVRRISGALAAGKVDIGRTLTTFAVALAVVGALLGILVWVCAAPLAEWLGFTTVLGAEHGATLVRWCAAWIAINLVTLMPGILARSAQAFVWITMVQTLSAALLWLGALALVRNDRPLTEVALVGIVLSLIAAGATAVAMRRHVDWSGPLRFDFSLLLADRHFSAGMFASQAASTVVYQGDRILISAIGSPAMAGAYALCANVANKMLAAVVALTSFAFPHASALHALGERERLQAFVQALDRGVAAIVMPVILPGWMLAGPFLKLWLGAHANEELVSVFRILWLAFALPAFAVPIGNLLAAHGNASLSARFAWLTAIVVVASILLLVPGWGGRGAAVAMLLGMATSFLFSLAARRELDVKPAVGRTRFWIGILIGLGTQLSLLLAVQDVVRGWASLVLASLVALAVFYGVRAIVGVLSPEEEQLLKRLAGRPRRVDKL